MRYFVSRSLGTHDGAFHADEVTACALLLFYDCIERDRIVRTRDPEPLERCDYVCDVGGVYDPQNHLFDHHQVDYQGEMSSAGMILLYMKEIGKIDSHLHDYIRRLLIKGVDDHDNGKELPLVGVCTYSHVIGNFNPVRYDASQSEENSAFALAVDFALGHLKRLTERYHYTLACRKIVEEQMRQQVECLFFDENIPWLDSFFELGGVGHPAKFLIMPSGGHWKLRGIPPSDKDKMQVRLPLPKEWAGLLDDELKRVSGISGAIFCHKGRFVSVWNSKEDALKALHYTLNHKELYEHTFHKNHSGGDPF